MNRNWPTREFGRRPGDYNPEEEYPGKEPLSEPETRILHSLASNFKPHAWVNVHTGGVTLPSFAPRRAYASPTLIDVVSQVTNQGRGHSSRHTITPISTRRG